MRLVRLLTATGLSLCLTVLRMAAQEPAASDACADAVRLVASGEATNEHAGWALAHVVRCPDGPATIATRWRVAEDRPGVLAQLRAWNYQIHDQRIAEAAIAVARDPSRPTNLRLLALETLVSYLGARLTGQVEFSPRLGAQPPAADIPDRVYTLSRELATDANPAVARAAKNKWQQITDVVPRLASLPAGTLTLVNVCGRTFRITNSSRIDLSTELAIAPERPALQLRIPAEATRDIVVAARDTARLLFGGREVASAATGGECH